MGRYVTYHTFEDIGIPGIFPVLVKKTVITDTKTGKRAEGLDWNSCAKSDRKAWEKLKKDR